MKAWAFLSVLVTTVCHAGDFPNRNSPSRVMARELSRNPLASPYAPANVWNSPDYNPAAVLSYHLWTTRQTAIAQGAAYHASMRPMRIANATRAREAKLAGRQARKAARLAKLDAELETLEQARRWTDSSGKHQLVAALVEASSWGVTLAKPDGTRIEVPMNRLSLYDQDFVSNHIASGTQDNAINVSFGR